MVGLYLVLGVTALAIDRRALLVSALAYVLYALSEPVDLPPRVSAKTLREAMKGKVLATAEAMGRYRRVAAPAFARMRR